MIRSVLLLSAFAAALAAQPAAGDLAPDFELESLAGPKVRLSDLTASHPLVLVVLRGYPGYQCPVCSRQVAEFVKEAAAFDAAAPGVRVVMVYPGGAPDLRKRAEEFSSGKNLPGSFELLLDPGYTFTNLYKLRWDKPRETAYPATFVIAKGGRITFSRISDSHGGRASAKEVVTWLRELR
jgi:peroxiredoxin